MKKHFLALFASLSLAGLPAITSAGGVTSAEVLIQSPVTASWAESEDPTPVVGLVTVSGLTDQVGAGVGVETELAVGFPDSGLVPWVATYATFPATYVSDQDSADEVSAEPVGLPVGVYRVSLRSRVNGGSWTYGDLDGSANGTTLDQLPTLEVFADIPTGTPTPVVTPSPSPTPGLTTVGNQPFNEVVANAPVDLVGSLIEFAPAPGDPTTYTVCRTAATELTLAIDSADTSFTLSDDGSDIVFLPWNFSYYGIEHDHVFVNNNGNLTFNDTDSQYDGSVDRHLLVPRISALFTDLAPGGSVRYREADGRVVFTWYQVPYLDRTAQTATAQLSLYPDGKIAIQLVDTGAPVYGGVVGLSAGLDSPRDTASFLSAVECGTGATPTPTPVPSLTATPSATMAPTGVPFPTDTPAPTPTLPATSTAAPTDIATETPAPTATLPPTPTAGATDTPAPTPTTPVLPTDTPSPTPTASPTLTPTPTQSPVPTDSPVPTASLVITPTATDVPPFTPTITPEPSPSPVDGTPTATPRAPVSNQPLQLIQPGSLPLSGSLLRFAPMAGDPTLYSYCRTLAADLTLAPDADDTTYSLSDDGSAIVPLPFDFPFYGTTYNSVSFNNNGNLTFEGTSSAYLGTTDVHLAEPRISALLTDIGSNNSLHYREAAGRVVFTWLDVHFFGLGAQEVTLQVSLYPDGRIDIQILGSGIPEATAIVGISGGVAQPNTAIDFRGAADCSTGATPVATQTPQPTATPTSSPAPTITTTPEPSATLPPTATPGVTDTPAPTPTVPPTSTPGATDTPAPSPTIPPTPSPVDSPTPTASPIAPSPTATPAPSPTATRSPAPTATPIVSPTVTPTPLATELDTDRDGLNDGREAQLGTNRNLKDTDGDLIEDGVEVSIGSNPLDPSSPANRTDSDGDGIPNAFDNSPNNPDVDNDGYWDGFELACGTNPNDAASHPRLGDANADGITEFSDAIILFNLYLGNFRGQDYAEGQYLDVNRDGVFDSVDAVILMNWYLRNIPRLPF